MKLIAFKSWKWWRIDLTGIGLLAGLILAGNWLVVDPIVSRRVNRIVQKGEMTFMSAELLQADLATESLQLELLRLRKALESQPMRLHSSQMSNQRLARLTAMASTNDLVLDQVRIGEPSNGEDVASVPINLAGQGSFLAFVKFVARVHATFPDTEIYSLNLSDNPSDFAAPTRFDIDLVWYAAPTVSSAR